MLMKYYKEKGLKMKLKATKKEMKQGYYKIISIGYCDAQRLLSWSNPIAYSCGGNGWSCDYHVVDGVLISEGYSPLSAKNTLDDYELVREYENKASDINTKEEHDALLSEFVAKATQMEGVPR